MQTIQPLRVEETELRARQALDHRRARRRAARKNGIRTLLRRLVTASSVFALLYAGYLQATAG